jgi:hypothetical protein
MSTVLKVGQVTPSGVEPNRNHQLERAASNNCSRSCRRRRCYATDELRRSVSVVRIVWDVEGSPKFAMAKPHRNIVPRVLVASIHCHHTRAAESKVVLESDFGAFNLPRFGLATQVPD